MKRNSILWLVFFTMLLAAFMLVVLVEGYRVGKTAADRWWQAQPPSTVYVWQDGQRPDWRQIPVNCVAGCNEPQREPAK